MARKFFVEFPSKTRIREFNSDDRWNDFIADVTVSVVNGTIDEGTELSELAARLLADYLNKEA